MFGSGATYAVAVELASLMLLAAVVAVVHLTRKDHKDHEGHKDHEEQLANATSHSDAAVSRQSTIDNRQSPGGV